MDHEVILGERIVAAGPTVAIQIRHNVYLVHRDASGRILAERQGHNQIVATGLNMVARLINNYNTPTYFQWIGVGRTGGGPTLTDTILAQEVGIDGVDDPTNHVVATPTVEASGDTDEGTDTAVLVATFAFSGIASPPVAIVESGVFNQLARSGSIMLARQVFAALNVSNGDSIQVTWKFNISPGA